MSKYSEALEDLEFFLKKGKSTVGKDGTIYSIVSGKLKNKTILDIKKALKKAELYDEIIRDAEIVLDYMKDANWNLCLFDKETGFKEAERGIYDSMQTIINKHKEIEEQ